MVRSTAFRRIIWVCVILWTVWATIPRCWAQNEEATNGNFPEKEAQEKATRPEAAGEPQPPAGQPGEIAQEKLKRGCERPSMYESAGEYEARAVQSRKEAAKLAKIFYAKVKQLGEIDPESIEANQLRAEINALRYEVRSHQNAASYANKRADQLAGVVREPKSAEEYEARAVQIKKEATELAKILSAKVKQLDKIDPESIAADRLRAEIKALKNEIRSHQFAASYANKRADQLAGVVREPRLPAKPKAEKILELRSLMGNLRELVEIGDATPGQAEQLRTMAASLRTQIYAASAGAHREEELATEARKVGNEPEANRHAARALEYKTEFHELKALTKDARKVARDAEIVSTFKLAISGALSDTIKAGDDADIANSRLKRTITKAINEIATRENLPSPTKKRLSIPEIKAFQASITNPTHRLFIETLLDAQQKEGGRTNTAYLRIRKLIQQISSGINEADLAAELALAKIATADAEKAILEIQAQTASLKSQAPSVVAKAKVPPRFAGDTEIISKYVNAIKEASEAALSAKNRLLVAIENAMAEIATRENLPSPAKKTVSMLPEIRALQTSINNLTHRPFIETLLDTQKKEVRRTNAAYLRIQKFLQQIPSGINEADLGTELALAKIATDDAEKAILEIQAQTTSLKSQAPIVTKGEIPPLRPTKNPGEIPSPKIGAGDVLKLGGNGGNGGKLSDVTEPPHLRRASVEDPLDVLGILGPRSRAKGYTFKGNTSPNTASTAFSLLPHEQSPPGAPVSGPFAGVRKLLPPTSPLVINDPVPVPHLPPFVSTGVLAVVKVVEIAGIAATAYNTVVTTREAINLVKEPPDGPEYPAATLARVVAKYIPILSAGTPFPPVEASLDKLNQLRTPIRLPTKEEIDSGSYLSPAEAERKFREQLQGQFHGLSPKLFSRPDNPAGKLQSIENQGSSAFTQPSSNPTPVNSLLSSQWLTALITFNLMRPPYDRESFGDWYNGEFTPWTNRKIHEENPLFNLPAKEVLNQLVALNFGNPAALNFQEFLRHTQQAQQPLFAAPSDSLFKR